MRRLPGHFTKALKTMRDQNDIQHGLGSTLEKQQQDKNPGSCANVLRPGSAAPLSGGGIPTKPITAAEQAENALDALARRQAFRASESLRSGKPAGKGQRWRHPTPVSATSEQEAEMAARYAMVQKLVGIYGKAWLHRTPWPGESVPLTKKQLTIKRWLSLVAWRAAFADLTQLPCGMVGRRAAGVRSLFISIDDEQAEEARNQARAVFAPDCEDSAWFEESKGREARRASDIKRARFLVFRRYLEPFKGKTKLTANQKRAKTGAIRRARVVCGLIEGQRPHMQSNNLKRLLKPLGLKIQQRSGRRSLVAELAKLS